MILCFLSNVSIAHSQKPHSHPFALCSMFYVEWFIALATGYWNPWHTRDGTLHRGFRPKPLMQSPRVVAHFPQAMDIPPFFRRHELLSMETFLVIRPITPFNKPIAPRRAAGYPPMP